LKKQQTQLNIKINKAFLYSLHGYVGRDKANEKSYACRHGAEPHTPDAFTLEGAQLHNSTASAPEHGTSLQGNELHPPVCSARHGGHTQEVETWIHNNEGSGVSQTVGQEVPVVRRKFDAPVSSRNDISMGKRIALERHVVANLKFQSWHRQE
jgi:hypothetical protein